MVTLRICNNYHIWWAAPYNLLCIIFITEANATIQKMNTESASGVSAAVGAAEAESRQLREELAILHKVVAGMLILRSFVWFDSLRPIINLSVKQGWVFLGWTSTKLPAQGPQHTVAGEARTRGPSVSSQAFYHWATALPDIEKLLPLWHIYEHGFRGDKC